MRRSIYALFALFLLVAFSGCSKDDYYLHYALKAAGENKSELKAVLKHYRTEDKDPQKLKAAKYLIANMPAHYSYKDTAAINRYYSQALEILGTGPSPDWQRDTLRRISDMQYGGIMQNRISDVEVITSDYLINNIDHAFKQWRTQPWAKHLSYDEFRDWLLPYKVTELQSLDAWRDTLLQHYSDSISTVTDPFDQRNTIYGAIEIVRNELHSKLSEIGHRVIWEDRGSIPMRSAATWVRMTYGSCLDYVTMGTAVFRSFGLPAAIDQVPCWGRNNDGHSWYVFPDDRGREQKTINSLIMPAGMQFYPYERIPKVWRSTYTINRDLVRYRNQAKYAYKFDLCSEDVTSKYNLTSDLEIEIDKRIIRGLSDRKYVHIAMVANGGGPQWRVLDYGKLKRGKACFKNMGRNMLYIVLGYDGDRLVPISRPFILDKGGNILYVDYNKANTRTASMDIRRKYYESYNVVDMRRRILGGKVQCSAYPDFRDALTLYTIERTDIPDRIELNADGQYRYWRYMTPDGSWGSISELSFYDASGNRLDGKGIANPEAGQDAIDRAYDGNLLSNFEINQPNGNWVGMDMGKPIDVKYISVSPRSDDNDVCPGNEYELFYFSGKSWRSLGYQIATGNSLHYEEVPLNTLLWLKNYTRGQNERPFIVRDGGEIEWW
ncbi:MAG: hypothetical protein J6W18_07740 [Bacteroidaceae bacterium]|nr:hypothetical protein [Bacteroidaceae bacterium]